MNKYYYNNDSNFLIFVTNETKEHTKYTFLHDNTLYEDSSITSFYSLVDKTKKNVIIDIGAQSGLYTLYAKHLPLSVFYSFEPYPLTYKLLNDNILINEIHNVNTFNLAISNRKGRAILNTCKHHNGVHTLGENVLRFQDIEPIEVETNTLDNLFYDKDIPVDFIKIDTEGHELFILQGGEKTIKKYKPIIQLEYNTENMAQCYVTSQMLDEYIEYLGYTFANMPCEERIICPK
jgi:FkbM family methyltransferase